MLQPHTAFPTCSGVSREQGALVGAPPSALQSGAVPPRLWRCEFMERGECSGENLESRTCPDKMQGASAQDETTRQDIPSRTGMGIGKNQRAPRLFAHAQPPPAVLVLPACGCRWRGCERAVALAGTAASCSGHNFVSQGWKQSCWPSPADLWVAKGTFLGPSLHLSWAAWLGCWWGARRHTNRLARLLARVCSALIPAFCFHEAWFLLV